VSQTRLIGRITVRRLRPLRDAVASAGTAAWDLTAEVRERCPPQQGMLHPDDRDRAQDLAAGDHRRRLINRHPGDLGRLVNLRLLDKPGPVRQNVRRRAFSGTSGSGRSCSPLTRPASPATRARSSSYRKIVSIPALEEISGY